MSVKVNPVNVTTLRESDPREKEIQKKSPQRDTQFFLKKKLMPEGSKEEMNVLESCERN